MSEPVVTVKQGKLRGKITNTCDHVPYYSFQGIPYAAPPLGDLRFKAPKPAESWEGIRDATKEGNRSISFSSDNEVIGDEDCLFLNIYTTKLPEEGAPPKSVMVWIHGGGFYTGSGGTDLFAPDYLIQEDVILVTFNYRLGILGFFSFTDPSLGVPGNSAFKDMVMALRWIQTNISYFNGDPNNVTIFGQSAGGIIVHLLVVSPMTKGLFHKAIVQSGTSFVGYDDRTKLKDSAKVFASLIGFHSDNEHELYEFWKVQPVEKIIEAFLAALKWMKNRNEGLVGPMVENTPYEEMFLAQPPEYYFQHDLINKVPIIIGCTTHDGMVYATKEFEDALIPPNFQDPELLVPREFALEVGSAKSIELGNKILKYYYGQECPSRRNIQKYIDFQTDLKYAARIKRCILLHHATNSNPIYMYRFALESPANLYKKFFAMSYKGVCHGDDLTYLFHTKYTQKFRPNSIEEKTKYRMVKLWTNFAKTGNPNPMEPDPLLSVAWRPVEVGKLNHLSIGKYLLDVSTPPDPKRAEFWDQIYDNYYTDLLEKILLNQRKSEDTTLIHTTNTTHRNEILR